HVLAIESRSMPVHEDVIPLFINQHRDENYVFTATLNHIDQVDVYLRDYFTQDEIALENDTQNIITFSVDENIPESIATDRFEIFFKEKLVGLDDHNHQNIALYPNPSEGAFYLSVSNGEQAVQVRIVNMVGQVIYEQTHTTNANGTVYVTANQAQNGVYLVYVSTNDGTPSIIRWINQ
ncbi:MAG TPA: T9SS type A sorting domain-containing protein, partial [Flavobacteriaceae bacterium]|nr:T9SS type A sorting domain-containing protein [Flavobacteriaceae bacterium]